MNTIRLRVTSLTVTLGLAAAAWAVTLWQANGMDMGVSTRLGPLAFFVPLWIAMMAAMMLPGAAPAVIRNAEASGRARSVPAFIAAYLAVWTLVGLVVYALYRPHTALVAGVVAIAAGVYELTPLKRRFRERCRDSIRSGFVFGLFCVGSSIGLMLLLVTLGVMSILWMFAIAVVVVAQKLVPPRPAIDVPAGAGDHRARCADRRRAGLGPRPYAADVNTEDEGDGYDRPHDWDARGMAHRAP